MPSSRPERITVRRTRLRRERVAGLVVVCAVAGLLCDQLLTASSSTTPSPVGARDREDRPVLRERGHPGVANLDPALRGAVRRAAADAADEGVALRIDSGWRSGQRQQQLLDEAVAKYGSEEEAARWVAAPDKSAHVAGDAVDVGPSDATVWLSQRGAEYGLCRIYANEPWHYELRPEAVDDGCPPMYADPTHDPRMSRRER